MPPVSVNISVLSLLILDVVAILGVMTCHMKYLAFLWLALTGYQMYGSPEQKCFLNSEELVEGMLMWMVSEKLGL